MDMISLEEMRRIEPALKEVPDEELERARKLLYDLGHLALECYMDDDMRKKWREEKKKEKIQEEPNTGK